MKAHLDSWMSLFSPLQPQLMINENFIDSFSQMGIFHNQNMCGIHKVYLTSIPEKKPFLSMPAIISVVNLHVQDISHTLNHVTFCLTWVHFSF